MPESSPVSADAPSWIAFNDPAFALQFRYPLHTISGAAIDCEQRYLPHMHVIDLFTPDRSTVYFEVAKMPNVEARQVYDALQARNAQAQAELKIGPVGTRQLARRPSLIFALHRGELQRQVLLIQYNDDVYRVTYDPRSQLNSAILATVTFREYM
jgi:hypothetical protein